MCFERRKALCYDKRLFGLVHNVQIIITLHLGSSGRCWVCLVPPQNLTMEIYCLVYDCHLQLHVWLQLPGLEVPGFRVRWCNVCYETCVENFCGQENVIDLFRGGWLTAFPRHPLLAAFQARLLLFLADCEATQNWPPRSLPMSRDPIVRP
jgi:hypothetical protein